MFVSLHYIIFNHVEQPSFQSLLLNIQLVIQFLTTCMCQLTSIPSVVYYNLKTVNYIKRRYQQFFTFINTNIILGCSLKLFIIVVLATLKYKTTQQVKSYDALHLFGYL